MFVKIICPLISIAISVLSVIDLNRIPYSKYSLRGNYWRIVFSSTVVCLIDIIMTVIILHNIPDGEYGTGVEILAVIMILIIYAPICVITSIRLKKRMKKFNDEMHDVSQMNALNCSIFFKAVFVLFEVIWLLEV